jgi:hypothetical protein
MKIPIQAAAAAITLFASQAAHAQGAVQWRVQDGGNGHWYQWEVQPSGISWTVAREVCIGRGGHLATPTVPGENQFIFNLTLPTSAWLNRFGPWLGGYQEASASDYSEPAGGWRWVTGEQWEWTAWWRGEPSNFYCVSPGEDKLHFIDYEPKWNDITNEAGDCEGPNWSFLIEWSADCNGDGIVDYGQCRDGSLPDTDRNNIPDCCESGLPCPLAAREWRTADGGNGHWYGVLRILPSESPESLFARATLLGGHAATIGSASENAFCGQFVVVFDGMLIGLRKLAGTNQVAWITGEPVSFVNWRSGEGTNISERYSLMLASDAAWLDTDLTPRQVVLVEFDADCNSDGIVDYGQIVDGTFSDGNSNGVPDCCEGGGSCCVGDILADRVVNGADLGSLLAYWGPVTASPISRACDLNGDNVVNGADIGLLLAGWGNCP